MNVFSQKSDEKLNPFTRLLTYVLRLLVTLAIPAIAFYVLYEGFLFLRAGDAPKGVITAVAIIWGVGGVAVLYWLFNWLVEKLPEDWRRRLLPFVFVGPAIAILAWYLAFPTLRTFWISLFGRDGPPREATLALLISSPAEYLALIQTQFLGLANYVSVFTERVMREAFRNNIFFWILVGTPVTVGFGLFIAVLADRSRLERFYKALIFLPMAISFVGASVIWRFIYAVRPTDVPQIGALNALLVTMGATPQYWPAYTDISPWNNLFLVMIALWLQAGFSMVVFSSALKGIPEELLEAARVDGANEIQVFFRIMLPYISGTIITVTTTVLIFTLKIFDVVWVMTGGRFGTEVIATQFFRQSFVSQNAGYGAAIAIVLLIAVIPVMIYNLRQFQEQEGFS